MPMLFLRLLYLSPDDVRWGKEETESRGELVIDCWTLLGCLSFSVCRLSDPASAEIKWPNNYFEECKHVHISSHMFKCLLVRVRTSMC